MRWSNNKIRKIKPILLDKIKVFKPCSCVPFGLDFQMVSAQKQDNYFMRAWWLPTTKLGFWLLWITVWEKEWWSPAQGKSSCPQPRQLFLPWPCGTFCQITHMSCGIIFHSCRACKAPGFWLRGAIVLNSLALSFHQLLPPLRSCQWQHTWEVTIWFILIAFMYYSSIMLHAILSSNWGGSINIKLNWIKWMVL